MTIEIFRISINAYYRTMKSLVYGRKWSACSPCYVITQQCHLKWVWAPVEKIGHLLAKGDICIEMKLVNQDYLIGFMVHLKNVVCIDTPCPQGGIINKA